METLEVVVNNRSNGIQATIVSDEKKHSYSLSYPSSIWSSCPSYIKDLVKENIAYIFTAHLPFLYKKQLKIVYNTPRPLSSLWIHNLFFRFLPGYNRMHNFSGDHKSTSIMKLLLNSQYLFAQKNKETLPFSLKKRAQIKETVIIPFSFGKDSFLTYYTTKKLGLRQVLLWYHDPTDGFEGAHKELLFKKFCKKTKNKYYFVRNELGMLRAQDEKWFGWESALLSWAVMAIPIAYKENAHYILFSNEKSTNASMKGEEEISFIPDYEQSSGATQELSLLTESLTNNSFKTSTLLQGLHDLGIVAILKEGFYKETIPYLMSCWDSTQHSRWCQCCSKCARMYLFLSANGIDPKEAGFTENMFTEEKKGLFNVFGSHASGTGWDAMGLSTNEQALAFYLCTRRGHTDPLIKDFMLQPLYSYVKKNTDSLIEEYFSLHNEIITPSQWKKQVDRLYTSYLVKTKKHLYALCQKKN